MRATASGGITTAQAIESVVAWQQAFVDSTQTPAAFTTPTLIEYFSINPSRPAGTYRFGGFVIANGTASNTQVSADLRIDGASEGILLEATNIAGGTFLFPVTTSHYHPGGVFTSVLLLAKPAGSGQVNGLAAHLSIVRLSEDDIT